MFQTVFFPFCNIFIKRRRYQEIFNLTNMLVIDAKVHFRAFLIILFALKFRILDTYGTNYKSLLKKYCVQVENYAIEIALIRTSVMTHYITRIYAIFKAWFSNWTQLRTLRSKAWKSRYLKKRVKLQKNPTQFP